MIYSALLRLRPDIISNEKEFLLFNDDRFYTF